MLFEGCHGGGGLGPFCRQLALGTECPLLSHPWELKEAVQPRSGETYCIQQVPRVGCVGFLEEIGRGPHLTAEVTLKGAGVVGPGLTLKWVGLFDICGWDWLHPSVG